METFIDQALTEQIAIHTHKNNEFTICRYTGKESHKYNGKKIQPQALMFCIRLKGYDFVAVIARLKGMSSATKFFNEQVEAICSGKLKVDYYETH